MGVSNYIDSIECKDAGNKAAPMLFAVTTEIASNPSVGNLDLHQRSVAKCRSILYRLTSDGFELAPGESASVVLVVSTEENLAGKQEFTRLYARMKSWSPTDSMASQQPTRVTHKPSQTSGRRMALPTSPIKHFSPTAATHFQL